MKRTTFGMLCLFYICGWKYCSSGANAAKGRRSNSGGAGEAPCCRLDCGPARTFWYW
jgi:hypothetical protein